MLPLGDVAIVAVAVTSSDTDFDSGGAGLSARPGSEAMTVTDLVRWTARAAKDAELALSGYLMREKRFDINVLEGGRALLDDQCPSLAG
jgi:hypothetical protein